MRALLVVAHGSRRAASNDEVRLLADSIRNEQDPSFELVDCAYLELAEPSIPEGIQSCVSAGATEIVVVPYFLSAGRHVAEDIPGIVAQSVATHPEVKIVISPYLGTAQSLPKMLLELAKK